MLEELFGDPCSDLDIEELDPPSLKHKWAAATSAEEANATVKEEHDPSKATKYIKVLDDCTLVDFGIEPDLIPKVADIIVIAPDGTESTKVYYQCKICPHQSQNQTSMRNHTRKCLNVRLQCFKCDYLAESTKSVNGHIATEHPSAAIPESMELGAVGQAKTKAAMAAIVHGRQQ